MYSNFTKKDPSKGGETKLLLPNVNTATATVNKKLRVPQLDQTLSTRIEHKRMRTNSKELQSIHSPRQF